MKSSDEGKEYHFGPGEREYQRALKAKRSAAQRFHDGVIYLIAGTLLVFALFFVGLSVATHFETKAVQKETNALAHTLDQEQQALLKLKNEAQLLHDDEYVLKLARSRYYLSKDGEVIFSVPEDNATKQAQALNERQQQAQQ